MKKLTLAFIAGLCTTCALSGAASPAALTIYNQDFAVVRETVPLDLKAGLNQVSFADASAFVEPASVILRDPSGAHAFQVLEQNFQANLASQELLLSLNEGKTLEFENLTREGDVAHRQVIRGKVIRSGTGRPNQPWYGGNPPTQPIIEVEGKLQFSLPGQPLFPALADDTILKPTLAWAIESEGPAKFDAELSYVTGGLRWEADYNFVLPEQGNQVDLVGWVTMDNQSGKTFKDARLKLMAGDVSKIRNVGGFRQPAFAMGGGVGGGMAPPVTEKTFDEYHLYTLAHPATLRDHESKQVEFVRAEGVVSTPIYVYDGAQMGPLPAVMEAANTDQNYGVPCNRKISVMREVTNSVANHLGLPLPKGKVRFYRRNSDTQLEFVGENSLDHTPRDEVVRFTLGEAFDLVGERKQTDYRMHLLTPFSALVDPATGLPVTGSGPDTNTTGGPWIDEGFAITLRNHKREPVEIHVVEHLYRWSNWDIAQHSAPLSKLDAQTIEFRVRVEADAERKITYLVHYSW